MTSTIRWSPQLHFHRHVDDLFPARFFDPTMAEPPQRVTSNEPPQRVTSWLPAAEGRIEDGTYVIQLALPGMDPKDVEVSMMENVLTVKGERKADHDTTGKDYFIREVAYGAFQRSFVLPEGVDGAQVEAKYANGMLVVRVPSPRAATPTTIEVKAA